MKSISAKKLLIFLVISWLAVTPGKTMAQDMPNNPREILKIWDYYKLTEILGEGDPIIDTLAGQAYISGMRYEQNWFNRQATVSYLFTDIDISDLQLKFWSPNTEARTGGKIRNVVDPLLRDSLIRAFQIQDSLRVDSVNRILRMKPDLITSMQNKASEANARQKMLYDLDSLRCDSLIHDMSLTLGKPLRQDTTSHTERARYSAVWIHQGLAVSLKDYTDYTEVGFSIPKVPVQQAGKFGIDSRFEIFEKLLLEVDQEKLEVSLMALPVQKELEFFNGLMLMVDNKMGQSELTDPYQENTLVKDLYIDTLDFNNDDIPELWIRFEPVDDTIGRVHKIYTIEFYEPILTFDSSIDIQEGLQARLVNGFQIEVLFHDGTKFMHPVNRKIKSVAQKFNSNGVLTGPDLILPGKIKYLKLKGQHDQDRTLESSIPLIDASSNVPIGDLIVHWKLDSGYWEIIDFLIQDL